MLPLAELQERIARASLTGDAESLAAVLVGGGRPLSRLAIHHRHYEASLRSALRAKFAATLWLLGSERFEAATARYVRAEPPRKPCIAEYGHTFPRFLRRCAFAPSLPYLEAFATLEWAVCQVSIAIDVPPLAWSVIGKIGPTALLDACLDMQPGVRYVRSEWAVDRLFEAYRRGGCAERFLLEETNAFIEIRGARGSFEVKRIKPATFAFRNALIQARSIGEAALAALDSDAAFDAGAALREMVAAGLPMGVRTNRNGGAA